MLSLLSLLGENKGRLGYFFLVLSFFLIAQAEAGVEKAKIVAKGDGIVVTEVDVKEMKRYIPRFIIPTERSLEKMTVCTVVMAKAAQAERIKCEQAEVTTGFEQLYSLSRCYLKQKLEEMRLKKGAVESYYLAHWRRFLDENGKLRPLDEKMRQRIRKLIVRAKAGRFSRQLCKQLMQKYRVRWCEGGS